MISAVYQITNTLNGKKYVGSSIDYHCRKLGHLASLRNNNHRNIHLQRSYNKYGLSNFKFKIIATCPPEYLFKLEQHFLDNYVDFKKDYNQNRNAKGGITCNKPVYQYNKKGILIKEWESTYNIVNSKSHLNFTKSGVNAVIRGTSKIHRGFIFLKDKNLLEERLGNLDRFGSKVIYQYDLKGNFIQKWKNKKTIVKITKYKSSSIGNCLSGKNNTSYDFHWSYKKLTKQEVLDKISNRINKKIGGYLKNKLILVLKNRKTLVKTFKYNQSNVKKALESNVKLMGLKWKYL